MAKLGINTGSAPNTGDGDTLLVGAIKINSNFDELYDFLGNGTNLNVGIWETNSTGISTTLSVGIGTTNAKSTLSVSGDGSFTGVVTSITFDGQINSGFGTITNIINTNSTITNLVGTSATITTYFGTDLTVTNATSTNNNVTNLVSTACTTFTLTVGSGGTVITTTSNGLIGINSISPTKTLDVIGDVRVGINTSHGIILTSPNGTQYRLIADNTGTLSTVAI